MHYKILEKTNQSEALLPLAELMEHLRVYDYQEESLISMYRDAAIDFAESYTNRMFTSGVVVSSLPAFKKSVYLPLSGVSSVESITAYDRNNKLVKVTDFRFNSVSGVLSFTKDYSGLTDFEIKYTVSVDVSKVPPVVKLGMMKLVATWYENREDISNGVSVAEVPMNHKNCFNLYRLSPTH